jgi:hypothetical protein
MIVMNLHGIRWYPAQWQVALSAVLALVVAFGFLSQTAASYVSTAGMALFALVTAALTRPWDIPLVQGAAATFLTGLAAFGLKWDDHQIAAVVTVLGLLMGYFIHNQVTPKAGSPYASDPALAPAFGKQAAPPKP